MNMLLNQVVIKYIKYVLFVHYGDVIFEPPRGKTNNVVSEQA